jgi:hypothetical protein
MVNSLKFSLFYDKKKGIYTTIPHENIDIFKLIKIYKSAYIESTTELIRKADEQTKKELKKQLPFITPYGTFQNNRANINLNHFNNQLICLDIDGLKESEVILVKTILIAQQSTLLCAVSPRGKGIKAFILISDTISLENCYNELKLNRDHIAQSIGLENYVSKIDLAQFRPTQPWFISFDENLYFNEKCIALKIDLIEYSENRKERLYFRDEVESENHRDTLGIKPHTECEINPLFMTPIKYRISVYFNNAVNGLIKFFAVCPEGKRHTNIIKVQLVASWIHYAPELEDTLKNALLDACCKMYGTYEEAERNNVPKSFEIAWSKAPKLWNKTIEQILHDIKYKKTN